MAVALVIGQALLCALIGWLTLGASREEGRKSSGPAVDQLAAPPPPAVPLPTVAESAGAPSTRPPASVSPKSVSRARSGSSSSSSSVRSPEPRRKAVPPQPKKSSVAPSPTIILLPPEPSPTPSPPVPSSRPPSPPAWWTGPDDDDPEVREPVTVGDRCRPEGAFGRTKEGVAVRCLRSWPRGPRWKIV